ncbi:ATP-dependent DNA helicase RecQ-like [Saccostrea cucullata]|uniref:ATP-dependent DNA helicase RecQ-like n=1 Tax=Saccostrea cuccullata TaxID=36930 RepID=UPI002ED4B537
MFNVNELKDQQKEILDSILSKKHTVAVLPTGYGKSLPYQMYIPVLRESHAETPKVVVCCPLVALMEDQVNRLNRVPIVSMAGNSIEGDERIKAGDVDIIFASPEALVGDPQWRCHMQKLNVGLLVIDEFHTIATW